MFPSPFIKSFNLKEDNTLIEINIPLNKIKLMRLIDSDDDEKISDCSECVYANLSVKIK